MLGTQVIILKSSKRRERTKELLPLLHCVLVTKWWEGQALITEALQVRKGEMRHTRRKIQNTKAAEIREKSIYNQIKVNTE